MASNESSKLVPAQRFVGMQVIDNKGSMIGTVKDVAVDFQNMKLTFRVTTKAKSELDLSWEDVLSVEDVVLLKKGVDMAAAVPPQPPTPTASTAPSVQAFVICSSCGTSAPGHAKFCPKCGNNLR